MTINDLLLPGSILQTIERHKKEHFEKVLVPRAEAWDEDKTKFAPELCILGESYEPVRLFDTPVMLANQTSVDPSRATISPCGKFLFVVRTRARGMPLNLHQGRRSGEVYFTTDVHVPVLAEIRKGQAARLWMSLTPHEVLSQRRGVRLATGKVMIGGLGMGWFLQKVCAKPGVKEVILVEREQGLVNWLLPVVKKLWPHVEAKLKDVVIEDAVEQIGKHGVDTRYLLDIWETYGEARRDEQFQQARSQVLYCWGWGDNDATKE